MFNNNHITKHLTLLTTVAAMSTLAAAANGSEVGLNFPGPGTGLYGSSTSPTYVPSTSSAGVIPQLNWNNAQASVGSSGTLGSGGYTSLASSTTVASTLTTSGLYDNAGMATSLTVSYSGHGEWNTSASASTTNEQMFQGYLDNNAGSATVTLANIPYARYDLYVYVASYYGSRTGDVTDGTTTFYYTTESSLPSNFALTTSTVSTSKPTADYALFSNERASSLTITNTALGGPGFGTGIAALQIVDVVPVPPSFALLAVGASGLLLIKRWRKRV